MSVLLFIFHNSAVKMKKTEKTKKALAFAFPKTIPIMTGFIIFGRDSFLIPPMVCILALLAPLRKKIDRENKDDVM